jgi:nucleoid-associated protein YgaU
VTALLQDWSFKCPVDGSLVRSPDDRCPDCGESMEPVWDLARSAHSELLRASRAGSGRLALFGVEVVESWFPASEGLLLDSSDALLQAGATHAALIRARAAHVAEPQSERAATSVKRAERAHNRQLALRAAVGLVGVVAVLVIAFGIFGLSQHNPPGPAVSPGTVGTTPAPSPTQKTSPVPATLAELARSALLRGAPDAAAHLAVETNGPTLRVAGPVSTQAMRDAVVASLTPLVPSENLDTSGLLVLPPPRIWTVREGDTYWGIAEALLGDGSLWPAIQAANPSVCPSCLAAGMRLALPPN